MIVGLILSIILLKHVIIPMYKSRSQKTKFPYVDMSDFKSKGIQGAIGSLIKKGFQPVPTSNPDEESGLEPSGNFYLNNFSIFVQTSFVKL